MPHDTPPAPIQPGDVNGSLDLRLGRHGGLQLAAGASALGLASVGLLVSAILLSTAVLVRAAKTRA